MYIYNGVHVDGYIQPISFNDYDVVITTYNILSKDLNYVGNNVSILNLVLSQNMYSQGHI